MISSLNELPATLIGLLEHFSPSGHEAQAVAWLVKHMERLGFTRSFTDPAGNAVGVMGDGPRQMILLGHIDTVPGEIPVRIEDGRLYGRGSVDAKGPLAAFVDAMAAHGEVTPWQLIVIGAVGEEADSPGARYVVDQYQPEFSLIGEPSGWQRLTLGYKGSANALLHFQAKNTHSAGKDTNTCEQAFVVWGRILEWAHAYNKQHSGYFKMVTPKLTGFVSGNDGFEDWATLQVGTRLPIALPPDDWYRFLSEIALPAMLERSGYPVSAYRTGKSNPLNAAFLAAIRQQGGKPGFLLKTGTTDMNIVGPAWGCPIAAYGPGDSSLDHTPDEHIHLEDYSQAVLILKQVIARLTRK